MEGSGHSRRRGQEPWYCGEQGLSAWLKPFALVCSILPVAAEENLQQGEGTEPGATPKKRKRKKQWVKE